MKKLFAVILVLTTLLIPLLTGCLYKKEYSNEDFTYYIYGSKKNDRRIEITGLTEAGNQKEVLVVPETIDGIPVKGIRKRPPMLFFYPGDASESGFWHSQKLKKLYIYSDIDFAKFTLFDCKSLEYVFIVNLSSDEILGSDSVYQYYLHICVKSKTYFERYIRDDIVSPANTFYDYNYPGSKNDGCFWIDNIEEGEKIKYQPPKEPTREGYVFGGWYKEPECLNKWNFSTDTMPETPQGAENDFYELKLYAKWIKK